MELDDDDDDDDDDDEDDDDGDDDDIDDDDGGDEILPVEFFWAPDIKEREQVFPSQRGPGRSPRDLVIIILMVIFLMMILRL